MLSSAFWTNFRAYRKICSNLDAGERASLRYTLRAGPMGVGMVMLHCIEQLLSKPVTQ